MLLRPFPVPNCRHLVISVPPAATVGICLECHAEVDVAEVERLWAEEAEAGHQPANLNG